MIITATAVFKQDEGRSRSISRDDVRTPPTPAVELEQDELRSSARSTRFRLAAARSSSLYCFHNRSYRQIAEILGIKPQVVANYMSAALTELRQTLRPLLPDGFSP